MTTEAFIDYLLGLAAEGLLIGLAVGLLLFLWAFSKGQGQLGAKAWLACAVMGAILGWIGIGLAALFSVLPIVSAPRLGSESDRIACPYCAELIKPGARVCRFCGRDLDVD